MTKARQYNERLQMSLQTVAPSGGGAALMDLRYNYSATQNNGRITSMQDLVSGETVTYQYDELQRLTSASTATWGNSYTFDGFGNLSSKTVTGGSAPSLSINVDGNTNRITTGGYGYDSNGNLTTLPGVTGIAYDADNRLTAANNEQYGYAPSNQRVWLRKSGGSVEHFTFYGVDGARLGVYSKGTYNLPLMGTYFAVVKQEVYFAGKRIRSGGLAVAEDRLGSTRREDTTASRFYPYGEEFLPTTAEDRQKFGTYYRDAGTQLDYANQRYYSASIGRFLTADPYQASGGPADPGSWNRYAYVGGDPINFLDPRGRERNVPTTDEFLAMLFEMFVRDFFDADRRYIEAQYYGTGEQTRNAARDQFTADMRMTVLRSLDNIGDDCTKALDAASLKLGFDLRQAIGQTTSTTVFYTPSGPGGLLGQFTLNDVGGWQGNGSTAGTFSGTTTLEDFADQLRKVIPGVSGLVLNSGAVLLLNPPVSAFSEVLHLASRLDDRQLVQMFLNEPAAASWSISEASQTFHTWFNSGCPPGMVRKE